MLARARQNPRPAEPAPGRTRARQKTPTNERIVFEGRDCAGRAPTFERAVEKLIRIHAEDWQDGGKSAAE